MARVLALSQNLPNSKDDDDVNVMQISDDADDLDNADEFNRNIEETSFVSENLARCIKYNLKV